MTTTIITRLSILIIAASILLTSCASQGVNAADTPSAPVDTANAAAKPVSANKTAASQTAVTERADSAVKVTKLGSGYTRQYLPVEPVESGFPDSAPYIRYSVNSEAAGSITGKLLTDVTRGKKTSRVTAKPNLGYKFIGWSDGVTTASRSGDTATKSRVITAIFDYDVKSLPVFAITTKTKKDVTSKTEYITGGISLFGCDEKFELADMGMEIRGRGNNTWSYPKKSYKFKLAEKQNLLGISSGKGRVWVLLANQCDQSLLRNHFALEFARNLGGIEWSPASASVEVYLNGEYRGVYLLAEEIKVANERVDVSEDMTVADTGFLVELSGYSQGEVFNVGGRTYQIRSDVSVNETVAASQKRFIEDYFIKAWNAVRSGDEEEICALLDINSVIDSYIVEEISKNLDVGWDSYYLHKDAGGKLHLGPMWDFDLSFGNANEGCEYYEELHAGRAAGSGGGNPWYYTLMKYEWYRERLKSRWDELKPVIDALPTAMLAEGEYGYESYCRNFEKWKIFGTSQNRETHFITSLKSYAEHYKYLAEWTANRIEWLDGYYGSEAFDSGEFVTDADVSRSNFGSDSDKKIIEKYKSLNSKIKLDTVKAPEGYANEGVENIFDGSDATKYCWAFENDTVITFSAKSKIKVKAYAIKTANDTEAYTDRNPNGWTLYGSTDGKSWTALDSRPSGGKEMEAKNFTYYAFECAKSGEFDRFKLVITDGECCQMSELLLLG